jgi:hypothetical protein
MAKQYFYLTDSPYEAGKYTIALNHEALNLKYMVGSCNIIAARLFNTMDLDITVALLKGMKPSTSSAILSQMSSERAQAITAELIGNNF